MIYPPARARTLHSAIGRHGGAAGPGTISPALIRSNPAYHIVIEDRKDIAVSVGERRGQEVPGGQIPLSLPSFPRSLGLFPPSIMPNLLSFPSFPSSLGLPPSIVPALLSFRPSFPASLLPQINGWKPSCINRLTGHPPSIDAYEHSRWYA